jgi:hypothetical protein
VFRSIFHGLFFTFFTPVYRCFAFSSILPLHSCIQVYPSLKSILKITIFCVIEKPLFLCVFILNGFPYIFVHWKESMKVSCYILYFSHKILIFLLFFISLYYICRIYSTLTLGENRKCSVDWFIADEIGMSTNNGGCCIFPNLCDAKHFIKLKCK